MCPDIECHLCPGVTLCPDTGCHLGPFRRKLQAYVVSKGLPFKVSVVTGPSGSYREHDILNFLEKWLLPWGAGREWNALSVFMHNETRRVLAETPALLVPGACHP